jgi:hypothetical protein
MTNLLIECILWGVSCGIIGAVYRQILAYEETFSFWWRYGARFEGRWFFKPVWGCAHCFAGQLAFWSWLAFGKIYPRLTQIAPPWAFYGKPAFYTFGFLAVLFSLLLTISAAILASKILAWYLEKKIL